VCKVDEESAPTCFGHHSLPILSPTWWDRRWNQIKKTERVGDRRQEG